MPDDYAGLYGFDKTLTDKLRAEMVGTASVSGTPYAGTPVHLGQAGTGISQPPPPSPPQSPLSSILDVLRSALQHAELLDQLYGRLRDAGILTNLAQDEAMPPTPVVGFALGEELAARIAHITLMNSGVRGLLERLAV